MQSSEVKRVVFAHTGVFYRTRVREQLEGMEIKEKKMTEAGVDDWKLTDRFHHLTWEMILTQCCIRSLLHHSGSNQIYPSEGRVVHVDIKHRRDCLCSFVCAFAKGLLHVCLQAPTYSIFEAVAKNGNNSTNRIQFLNTTAVVTVTMWHIRQQGGCVSSLMTKSVSSRDPKKIKIGSQAQLDLGSILENVADGPPLG